MKEYDYPWFKRNRNVINKDREELYAKQIQSFMKIYRIMENISVKLKES